jgi:hypothetical protein
MSAYWYNGVRYPAVTTYNVVNPVDGSSSEDEVMAYNGLFTTSRTRTQRVTQPRTHTSRTAPPDPRGEPSSTRVGRIPAEVIVLDDDTAANQAAVRQSSAAPSSAAPASVAPAPAAPSKRAHTDGPGATGEGIILPPRPAKAGRFKCVIVPGT